MAKRSKGIAILVCLALIGAGAYLAYEYLRNRPRPPEATPPPAAPPPQPDLDVQAEEPAPPAEPGDTRPLAERLRELAATLSSHPLLARFLEVEGLLQRLVAAVEAVSHGHSPRLLVDFLGPDGRFAVFERDGKEFIDGKGCQRYDALAEAFSSLDAARVATLLNRFRAEIEAIHRSIAKPGQTFREALARAMVELLRVPVVDGPVPLQRIEVTLKIADPDLEAMSEAQKHLLRMGPHNVRKVQQKLRELARALELPDEVARTQPLRCALCP